jgi:hypothetical protein
MQRPDRIALAALALCFLAVVAAVDPRGDFPVNDDWAFAATARALAFEGRLAFTGWQSMPLITHAGWGALFLALLGDDFTWLRLSTLVLAAAGLLGAYALSRQLGASPWGAGIASLTLVGSPWYLGLSFSYMSDVPFLALLLLATAAWAHPRRRPGRSIGALLAVAATLSRQNGLALPLGAGAAAALGWPARRRDLVDAIVLGALAVLCLRGAEALVAAGPGLPELYHLKTAATWAALSDFVQFRHWPLFAERSAATLLYLGLCLLPVTLLLPARPGTTLRRTGFLAVLALVVGLPLSQTRLAMPCLGNVWPGWGFGPWLDGGPPPVTPPLLAATLTVAAVLGALLLVDRLGALAGAARHPAALPLAVGLAAAGPMVISHAVFLDRYLLPLVAFASVGLAALAGVPRRSRVASALVAALLGLAAAVVGVHDHQAWQRARWKALDALLAAGVDRCQVAGGFELDNARPALDSGTAPVLAGRRAFAISSTPLPGYEVLARAVVGAWGSGPREVLVLRGRARGEGDAGLRERLLRSGLVP